MGLSVSDIKKTQASTTDAAKNCAVQRCPKKQGGASKKSEKPPTKNKYPNTKEIELDSKGRFRDKHGKSRTNAGPNAPDFNKWKENGGTVKYDETTDTIIYGKPSMETASMGKTNVEVPYKSGPPDNQRYPDFSDFSKETVEIPNMKGQSENKIHPPEGGDFSKAWEKLSKQKGNAYAYIEDKFDMNRRIKGTGKEQWPDKSPEDYTWHHQGDKSTMQLVDEAIHREFTHKGGASASR